MINNETRSSRKIILFAIPICLMLAGIFACEEYITTTESEVPIKETSNFIPMSEMPIQPDVDEMPRFPGCENTSDGKEAKETCANNKMLQYIYENLNYPEIAIENGVQGTCIIQFQVNDDGSLSEAQIVRDIGAACGDAALQVVKDMNSAYQKWIPGKQAGKNTSVTYTLPIDFKLDNKAVTAEKKENQSEKIGEHAPGEKNYLMSSDTTTFFNKETQKEETVIIEEYTTKEIYEAHKEAEKVSTLTNKQIANKSNTREYTIVGDDTQNEKKYILSSDTITIFDEDTYEETVRVIDVYDTKERYDAYQEAAALERYIFIRNTAAKDAIGGEILYVDIDEYLKNSAPKFLNEKGTYVYEIYEKGKLIETSKPFALADIKKD